MKIWCFTENVYWQNFAGFEYFDERRFAPNSTRTRTNSTRCTRQRLNASIGKGKARKPYAFGVKVSVAVTHKQGLLVGARSFTGNPYDGHLKSDNRMQRCWLPRATGDA